MNEDRNQWTVVPDEVTSLLDQRGQVQDWIERLGDFREEASREVYERVREDYEGRLADLNERLAGHRTALQSSLDEHRERVSELQRRRDEQAAELEEAKLRHAVGEFADDEWERRRGSGGAALDELDGTLEGERGALRELQDALSSLPGGSGEATGPEAELGEAEPTGEAEPAGEAEPGEGVAERRGTGAEGAARPDAGWSAEGEGPSREEEEGEERGEEEPSLAGAAAPGEPADRRAADEEPAGEEEYEDAREDEEFLDELEFLESLSLEESDRFDAVSAMLDDEEEEGPGGGKEG